MYLNLEPVINFCKCGCNSTKVTSIWAVRQSKYFRLKSEMAAFFVMLYGTFDWKTSAYINTDLSYN